MADARVELIESLKDQAIRAKLLRMTDPEIAMVELANNPNDEDRIRICAIGILSGFTPGDEQFAIFGGGFDKRANKPKPGKLYIKERGFRTLFSHLGIVPEVRTGHPTWGSYGGGDKKLWSVTGTAECSYAGENYTVEFAGESAVRIEGYDSDNTAGIAAKCRRRLLQALWVKVSPILTQDQAYDSDDEPDTVPVETPARIDAKPVNTEPSKQEHEPKQEQQIVIVSRDEMEAMTSQHKLAGVAVVESLADDKNNAAKYGALWDAIGNAKTATNLKAEGKSIKDAGDYFTDVQLDPLRQWYTFRMNQITGKIQVAK